jgi:hypothetical protein
MASLKIIKIEKMSVYRLDYCSLKCKEGEKKGPGDGDKGERGCCAGRIRDKERGLRG